MDTGFFKWLWRFNAAGIAAIVLTAGLLFILEFAGMLFREQQAPQTINVDQTDTSLHEDLEIGPVSFDTNTGLITFQLFKKQEYEAQGYLSGNRKTTFNNSVNRGYLDPETGETRWLLDRSDGLIIDWEQIVRGDKDNTIHVATIFRLVTTDTTGDRRLSPRDLGDVYIFGPGGRNLTLLAKNTDKLSREFALDETTEVVSLTHDGKRELAFVSLANRTVMKRLSLPDPRP